MVYLILIDFLLSLATLYFVVVATVAALIEQHIVRKLIIFIGKSIAYHLHFSLYHIC
ncbi:hypothetical protein Pint_23433 [Pistacia integerrima]|uniref:Uncharacterized protein n=1 Tax=Pistacia integerrima TaxID=434235 RepID=A0ACC0YJZ6_9ROSI|nr:hypothetical protein Pint_23433 [Pistacia integerrima]